MLVKQLRFNNIEISSNLLSFKGFVVSKNNVILSPAFTVSKGLAPSKGSLDGIIIVDGVDYSTLTNIEYSLSSLKNLEIIIDFATEIDIDSIRCVCGSLKQNHFRKIAIDTKSSSGNWVRFNDSIFIPDFKANDVSVKTGSIPFVIASVAIDPFFKDQLIPMNANTLAYNYIARARQPIKTGKYFVEVSVLDFINSDGSRWNCPIGIMETTSILNQFADTGRYCYQVGANTGGFLLEKITNGSYSVLQTVGTGQANNVQWPEMTAGLFIDLDNNKIKIVFNGMFHTNWFDITKSNANASFYPYIQFRNLGANFKHRINSIPLYQYTDLTSEYNTDLFLSKKGWIRYDAISTRKTGLRLLANDNTLIKRKGDRPTDYKTVTAYGKYRLSDSTETGAGYGYFKNSVFIDYPPKEPTSKRVVLYSIVDGKVMQQVWSDSLSGQYEFKFIAMRKPYLIFTYDSDEDYNAVMMGPVYPTLMPQFEGIVKP